MLCTWDFYRPSTSQRQVSRLPRLSCNSCQHVPSCSLLGRYLHSDTTEIDQSSGVVVVVGPCRARMVEEVFRAANAGSAVVAHSVRCSQSKGYFAVVAVTYDSCLHSHHATGNLLCHCCRSSLRGHDPAHSLDVTAYAGSQFERLSEKLRHL